MEDDTVLHCILRKGEREYILFSVCKLFNGEPTIQALRKESVK